MSDLQLRTRCDCNGRAFALNVDLNLPGPGHGAVWPLGLGQNHLSACTGRAGAARAGAHQRGW
jgi:hypothetical protein